MALAATAMQRLELTEAIDLGVRRIVQNGEDGATVAEDLVDHLDPEALRIAAVQGMSHFIAQERVQRRGRDAESVNESGGPVGSRPRIPLRRNMSARDYFTHLEYSVDGTSRSLIDCSVDDLDYLVDQFKARETGLKKRRVFVSALRKECTERGVDKVAQLPEKVLAGFAARAQEVW